MSPRIKILRKVSNLPIIKGFKPFGGVETEKPQEFITLHYEEYESLRLSDYEILNHHKASQLMGISRPTYTRIYASALQKIAKAFVEGRPISIEGGKVYFDSDWHHCLDCGCFFNHPEKEKLLQQCPLCGSTQYENIDPDETEQENNTCDDLCVCPNCGFEKSHHFNEPCNQIVCEKCNHLMKRKGRNY